MFRRCIYYLFRTRVGTHLGDLERLEATWRPLSQNGQVKELRERNGRPRWERAEGGGARLLAADGTEFTFADHLARLEVERLLGLQELEAVRIECGAGIESWVAPSDARRVWLEVEPDLTDIEGWRPPRSTPGALPYRAELWRSRDGRHAFVFTNE